MNHFYELRHEDVNLIVRALGELKLKEGLNTFMTVHTQQEKFLHWESLLFNHEAGQISDEDWNAELAKDPALLAWVEKKSGDD